MAFTSTVTAPPAACLSCTVPAAVPLTVVRLAVAEATGMRVSIADEQPASTSASNGNLREDPMRSIIRLRRRVNGRGGSVAYLHPRPEHDRGAISHPRRVLGRCVPVVNLDRHHFVSADEAVDVSRRR